MPIDKRAGSASEALADVSDGATVLISGFGGAGFPNILLRALRDRGPKNLTLVVNSAVHRYSFTHELIEAGLVRKVVCTAARGHSKEPSAFERLWTDGKIELECVPQGTFAERIRAGGAGIPAFYTPVGYGTELAHGKEVRRFHDRDFVLEHAIKGDLALVGADTADRHGGGRRPHRRGGAQGSRRADAARTRAIAGRLCRPRGHGDAMSVDAKNLDAISPQPLNRLQIAWRAAQDITDG